MAIPNVETTASRTDYDVRTNRSNSKDRNSTMQSWLRISPATKGGMWLWICL